MPLFIMTVVDGLGETQIVGLVILKFENIRAVRSGLAAFKANNQNHVKTKVNKKIRIFVNLFTYIFIRVVSFLKIFIF